MAAPMECAISGDLNGQMFNCCVWDPISGSSFANYKGGNSSPRTLSLLGGQFLLSSVPNKSLINAWAVQRRDQQQVRMVCPGVVTAMATSPDSMYCVAGIGEKIHVWQISTGHLVVVISKHFQRITNVCFTDDGSYFITGGDDNLIMVWDISSVLEPRLMQNFEPLYMFSQHSLPVTDLHCGNGGICARLVSSSQDQTCKLWDLSSGQLLHSFIFNSVILSVAMDTAEYFLFAGGLDGKVRLVNLFEKNAVVDINKSSHDEKEEVFKGHSNAVTCLSVSIDGSMLLSGSDDGTVRVWHITSKQCTRIFKHKGPVTNAMFMTMPEGIQNSNFVTSIPLQPFQRNVHVQGSNINIEGYGDTVPIRLSHLEERVEKTLDEKQVVTALTQDKSVNSEESEELLRVKYMNQELHKFVVESILQTSNEAVK